MSDDFDDYRPTCGAMRAPPSKRDVSEIVKRAKEHLKAAAPAIDQRWKPKLEDWPRPWMTAKLTPEELAGLMARLDRQSR